MSSNINSGGSGSGGNGSSSCGGGISDAGKIMNPIQDFSDLKSSASKSESEDNNSRVRRKLTMRLNLLTSV